MRNLAMALLRRLPHGVRARLERAATPITGRLAVRGLRASPEALQWVAEHPRSVSIVIPSYNDYPLLKKCIASVQATAAHLDFEIIVVDDFCQEPNREQLRKLISKNTRVIFKSERQGFAATVNRGMAEATKDDIVLLNSDTVAVAGWLDELQYAAFGIDQQIGLVSPKLLYPSGRIQYGGTFHARDLAPQWFAHFYGGKWARNPEANVGRYIFGISGACVYVKAEVYQQIGGLDERYWLGFEDVDYAMEAWIRGLRCYYHPASTLFHHESASRGYSQGKRELKSLRDFWAKWNDLFASKSSFDPARGVLLVDSGDEMAGTRSSRFEFLQKSIESAGLVVTWLRITEATSEEAIKTIARHAGLIVAVDVLAAEAAWVGAAISSPVVLFLSEADISLAQKDPQFAAKLKPEYFYVTSSRHMNNRLATMTAWQPHVMIPIAVTPPALSQHGADTTVVILAEGESPEIDAIIAQFPAHKFIKTHAREISPAIMQELEKSRPSVVMDLRAQWSEEEFLELSSRANAVVAWFQPEKELVAMDGFNTMLIKPGDWVALSSRLRDLVEDSEVLESVANNARKVLSERREIAAKKYRWLVESFSSNGLR